MNFIKIINSMVLFALCIAVSNNINAIARYKARPLETLAYETLNNGEVGFRYKLFNKKDCKTYLGRRRIKRKGYTPIQVSITNNTNTSFNFSLNDVSLPCISYNNVAHDVRFVNTAKKIAAWLIPCLWIPIIVVGAWANWFVFHMWGANPIWVLDWLIGTVGVVATATTAPPAIAAGIKIPKAQKQLLTDYESKSLHDTTIKPFDTINGIVFVRTKELKNVFSLTLVDTFTHKKYTLSTDVQRVNVLQETSLLSLFNSPHQIFWNNPSLIKE